MKLPWKSLQTKKRACLRNNIIPRSSLAISFLYTFLILFFLKNWIFFYFLLCWRKGYQIFTIPHMSHFWSPHVPKRDFSGTHSIWHSCSYHCLRTFPWGWLLLFSASLCSQAQSWQPGPRRLLLHLSHPAWRLQCLPAHWLLLLLLFIVILL